MSRRANPALIGGFVLGAILLAVVTTFLLAGGRWFEKPRQHIMYFEGAAQGLQVGAPVLFLGVKVGFVKRIQLGLDEKSSKFLVPVTVEVEPAVVQSGSGSQIDLRDRQTIRQLVQRGLRARLKMQSLLTGQLYVDLDFFPDKPARYFAIDQSLSEIPTIPTTADEFSTRLEGFPMDKFLMNIAAIGESMNKILASVADRDLTGQLAKTLQHLAALTAKLDAASLPLAEGLQQDLAMARSVLSEARTSLAAVKTAADRVGNAADRVSSLTAPDAELLGNIARASRDLALAARNVQMLSDAQSPTVQGLDAALKEIVRAAGAMRQMADTLEHQPEAVLRGKQLREEK